MKNFFTFLLIALCVGAKAQKVESMFFNLYTDSLKKGVYNYINVVAKMSDGNYLPLTDNELEFTSTGGRWQGNSLILDSSFKNDSVVVVARLKNSPLVSSSKVIYLKKNLYEPPLKTEKELLEDWKRKGRKQK